MCCSTECEDLQVLLRLMQSGRGYLKDGDRFFEPRQLLRLAVLGGKVQVPACVAQCAAQLAANMTGEDAVELLSSMPDEMDGLEEIKALRDKALDVLVAATERKPEAQLGGRLCACLAAMIEEQEEGEVEARVWRAVGNLPEQGALEAERWGRWSGPWRGSWGPCTNCGAPTSRTAARETTGRRGCQPGSR
jgi:hypothetical protein